MSGAGFERFRELNAKQLEPGTWALVFEKEDDPISLLERFAKEQRLTAASFSAIGAFSSAVLGYFDHESKEYEEIDVDEQLEVLTLLGDVAVDEDKPKIYAHVVLGKRDATAVGGHLLRARAGRRSSSSSASLRPSCASAMTRRRGSR